MSFLVTGYGRSGTTFLARELSKGNIPVVHEPFGDFPEKCYNEGCTERYFTEISGGVVDSYMRFWVDQVKVDKLAIIFRKPEDVILSICNRKGPHIASQHVRPLILFYERAKQLVRHEQAIPIEFDRMTTSKGYLAEIAKQLGIDLPGAGIDLSPSNRNKRNPYKKLPELVENTLKNERNDHTERL